jgi:hypothetical protein
MDLLKNRLEHSVKHLYNLGIVIILVAISRLIPHWPNLTAIGASAICMGYAWPKKSYALIVPIFALLVSDLIIGFHNQMIWVYGSVALSGLVVQVLGSEFSPKSVLKLSLTNSILFFLITNFGVWHGSGFYPQTFSGLIESYLAAVPFSINDFLGNALYSSLGMLAIQKLNASLRVTA